MTVDIREHMRVVMLETLADERAHGNWNYYASRPCYMPTQARFWKQGTRVVGDCSKGCQFIAWWSPPAPDPMQQGWGPNGNSQTLWMNCQHLDRPDELLIGDFVTFGFNGSEHAACVLERGSDPLVWSFGHQGSPNSYRLSFDRRLHQYLRNKLPDYKPTPDDRLRAKTGWFAWMAWYQGEGDWQHHKPRDPNVRPNVPRLVPLSWWKRRAQFLLARKHGNKASSATP